jgi:hypothetical protein
LSESGERIAGNQTTREQIGQGNLDVGGDEVGGFGELLREHWAARDQVSKQVGSGAAHAVGRWWLGESEPIIEMFARNHRDRRDADRAAGRAPEAAPCEFARKR